MRIVLDYGGTVVDQVDESEYSLMLGDDPPVDAGGYIAYKAFSLGIIDDERQYITALASLTDANREDCWTYLAERKHAADLPGGRDGLLRELARDHELVLFTDQVRPWVEDTLEAFGIRDVFDALVVSSDVGAEKPHPRGYEAVLDGTDPGDAVMVSDELNADLLMADYFGFATVWVENDHEPVRTEPDARIDDLAELPDVLGELPVGVG